MGAVPVPPSPGTDDIEAEVVTRVFMELKRQTKNLLRATIPLSLRKQAGLVLDRQAWLDHDRKSWFIRELLRDYAETDPGGYHRFLWANHLAYAATYTLKDRFTEKRLPGSREIFFEDLLRMLETSDGEAGTDVRSVLEVGCSLGYQLHFMESALFPNAVDLTGIDIDEYAVSEGMKYLGAIGSKVRLIAGDMGRLDGLLGSGEYDIVVCTGVLMYLDEEEALHVIREMLRRCGRLLGLSGPAYTKEDNRLLERSIPRKHDGSLIHNLDALVEKAGGKVVGRRWGGASIVEGHSIYFVFAVPEER
jgi:SAM-dependent methyltransferase